MLNEFSSIVSDFGRSPKADNNVQQCPYILKKGARHIHVGFAKRKSKPNHHHPPLTCFRKDKKFKKELFEGHLQKLMWLCFFCFFFFPPLPEPHKMVPEVRGAYKKVNSLSSSEDWQDCGNSRLFTVCYRVCQMVKKMTGTA